MPPRSTSRSRPSEQDLATLLDDLRRLHTTLEQAATDPRLEHQALNPAYQASAQNLLAYLALRGQDLHALQLQLSAQGLSSLGRSEAAVLPTVKTLIGTLERLLGSSSGAKPVARTPNPLARHARALFGAAPRERAVRSAQCASWSPCRVRRQTTIRWFAICSRPGWIACVSTAPMTTPPPGRG